MNETPSAPDAASFNRQLARLRTFTIVSLSLNGLILILILSGIVAHHHHRMPPRDFGGRDGGGECSCPGDFHRGFDHHHGGMDRGGWGRDDMDRGDRHFGDDGGPPDRPEFKGDEGDGFGHRGFGDDARGGPGFGGPHRMMGMGPMDGPPPDPDRMADGILAHLTQQLTLSDDQKAKIKPIITAQVAQFQKEMEDRRQEMQKEMADGRAKIRALLNPDQQKELDQLPVPGEKPGDTADANPPAK